MSEDRSPHESSGSKGVFSYSDWGAATFVWGVWALTLASALVLAYGYSKKFPHEDDWWVVSPILGEPTSIVDWLWEQHGQHRIVIPKLIWLPLYQLSSFDFRAGMIVNVLALGAAALAMILRAKHLRGGIVYWDAFFPLLFLNWGHWAIQWAFELQFLSATVLACILLMMIVRTEAHLNFSSILLIGACTALLPLCGLNGVAMAPVFALWLGYLGVLELWEALKQRSGATPTRRAPSYVSHGLVLISFAFVVSLIVALYFYKYQPSGYEPHAGGDLAGSIITTGKIFSSIGDSLLISFWPYSGLVLPVLFLVTVGLLSAGLFRVPTGRSQRVEVFLFMSAIVVLIGGTGWGRARYWAQVGDGLTAHYAIVTVPLLCCIYFVWEMYGSPIARRLVQICLFSLLCGIFGFELSGGFERRLQEKNPEQLAELERDLNAGIPLFIIAERYEEVMFHEGETEVPLAALQKLHDAGVKPYRYMGENPVYREDALPIEPAEKNQITWEDGLGQGLGSDACLIFALGKPRFVYAIRLRYSYVKTGDAPVLLRLFWTTGANGFSEDKRNATVKLLAASKEKIVTIWVNGTIDRFRLHPDNKPFGIKISGITLLVK